MPELPEVETVRRGLSVKLEGRRLTLAEARRPDLRVPLPDIASLTGGRITRLDRRAKYILMRFDDGRVLIVHLGMSGRMVLTEGRPNRLETHDHVVFETEEGVTVRFNDPRRFGLMVLTDEAGLGTHPLLKDIGPEPLGDDFTGTVLAKAIAGKKTPIKAAILDQKVVAGIGNIYASEALYQARISPERLASTVQGVKADRLVTSIKETLERAIAAGGSSLRDHVQPSGELGYFQHEWKVYGREGDPCPTGTCGQVVLRAVHSNRSTFYCARCQR